ncbi:MAG: ComF family protein, partial [Candidatus Omnitrophica bacterium]|nr:ComF family protein [Candidatus Omnitrophota bacterium]
NLVCIECWEKIKRNMPPFCHSCGRHLKMGKSLKNICPLCIKKLLHFDRAFSPCVYEGTIKELIHHFKYRSKDYLGLSLSRLMIEFIREYNLPLELIDFIIPIPLHKTRLREREFNQAQILSDYIAKEFNKEILHDSLRRLRYTKTQTELEETQRFLNVKGGFSVSRKEMIKGKNILLVDDVLTTGATSSEAAYALKDAGATIVFVLTLAN